MTDELRAHIRRETIANFVINAVLNGLIIWLLKKNETVLGLWGETGFGIDIVITAFMLMFLVAVIVSAIHRRRLRKGVLPAIQWDMGQREHRILSRFPRSLWLTGLCFGLMGVVVVAPLTVAPFAVLGITELSPLAYTLFKAGWTGVVAALMIRSLILMSLAQSEAQPQTA